MAHWILLTEWVVRLVFVLLIALSIWSIGIMIEKSRFLKRVRMKGEILSGGPFYKQFYDLVNASTGFVTRDGVLKPQNYTNDGRFLAGFAMRLEIQKPPLRVLPMTPTTMCIFPLVGCFTPRALSLFIN